jgi:hypothetical protein
MTERQVIAETFLALHQRSSSVLALIMADGSDSFRGVSVVTINCEQCIAIVRDGATTNTRQSSPRDPRRWHRDKGCSHSQVIESTIDNQEILENRTISGYFTNKSMIREDCPCISKQTNSFNSITNLFSEERGKNQFRTRLK